jgi:hypothetical protein
VRLAGEVSLNDVRGNALKIGTDDIRLGSKRVEHFSWSCNEGRDATRLKRTYDIPCVRSNHPKVDDLDAQLL